MKRLIGAMVVAISLVALAGSAIAAKEKSQLAIKVDPAFWEKPLNKIGLLGISYPISNDAMMAEIVPDLINGTLQDQGEFTLLYPDDIRMAAERGGFKQAYDTLIRVWRNRGEIDPPSLATVQAAVGLDAIVGVELTHWEQHKLDFSEEGYSTTTVGLRSRLWSVSDRILLWEASLVKVGKSPPYDPSGSSASDVGGNSRQTVKTVPDPPKYEEIAEDVVLEVIGSYPKPEDKDRLTREAKKKKKKEAGR